MPLETKQDAPATTETMVEPTRYLRRFLARPKAHRASLWLEVIPKVGEPFEAVFPGVDVRAILFEPSFHVERPYFRGRGILSELQRCDSEIAAAQAQLDFHGLLWEMDWRAERALIEQECVSVESCQN